MIHFVKDSTEIAVRLITAIGGFLGGTSILVYMPAKSLMEAFKRVSVSVIAAGTMAIPITRKLFDEVNDEVLMGVSFIVGFIAWFTLGSIARFFENKQGRDIVEIAKEVKQSAD